MNSFQFHLWEKMIRSIQDFDEEKINFHTLVGKLEESIELAEFHDTDLIRHLDEYFHPLEEADSDAWYELGELDYGVIKPCLQKMKNFMLELEQNQLLHSPHHSAHRKFAHL